MAVGVEPYKKFVSITVVRSVWNVLRRAFPRNPAMVERLMTLYLGDGVSFMMSFEGLYMACDFDRLSKKALNYHHPNELIKAVISSSIFTIGKADNPYGISWFASPLYLNELELSKAMNEYENSANTDTQDVQIDTSGNWNGLFSQVQLNSPTVGLYNSIINNTGIENIILSGRRGSPPAPERGVAVRIESTSSGSTNSFLSSSNPSSNRMATPRSFSESVAERTMTGAGVLALPPLSIRETEVNHFIREMYSDTEFFIPLREMLTAKKINGEERPAEEVFTVEQAREILNRLMYYHVKPYFMEQLRFFKYPSHEGRREWLRNWLYGEKGKKLIKSATNYCRQKWKREAQQAFNAQRKAMHDNHPLSPYEWTDPNTGKRYYRESPTEVVIIPDDAPVRMSEEVRWNKFSKQWET